MSRNSKDALIELEGIKLGFQQRLILDVEQLQISQGGLTVLTGANGAGKTSLLRVMAGLQESDQGRYVSKGIPFHTVPKGLSIDEGSACSTRNHIYFQEVY